MDERELARVPGIADAFGGQFSVDCRKQLLGAATGSLSSTIGFCSGIADRLSGLVSIGCALACKRPETTAGFFALCINFSI